VIRVLSAPGVVVRSGYRVDTTVKHLAEPQVSALMRKYQRLRDDPHWTVTVQHYRTHHTAVLASRRSTFRDVLRTSAALVNRP
jgi:hypothetical protein